MAYEKLDLNKGLYVNLKEPGEFVEGEITGITLNAPTQYKDVDYLHIKDALLNECFMVITAQLKNVDWNELIGQKVKIVLKGHEVNPKTKRSFKSYEVFIDK